MAHLTDVQTAGQPAPATKPAKPFDGFPLTPHASGKWMKKINGKIHYFGNWARVKKGVLTAEPNDGEWAKALKLYREQAASLHGESVPQLTYTAPAVSDPQPPDVVTVADLCDDFRAVKEEMMKSGEIGVRAYADYRVVTDELVAVFGERPVSELTPQDFGRLRASLSRREGHVRLKNTITRIRAVFAFGHKNGMTPEVQYGTLFDKPTKAMLRKHRAKGGVKLIEPPDIHKLIGAACPVMKAMILLGLNAGYGNSDIATLPLSAVNLDTGWIDYPRPKNGVARRAKLWSETVEALRAAVQLRPKPKDPADAGLVFLTPRGGKWVGLSKVREKKDGKPQSKGSFYQGISVAFAKLAKAQGVSQPGVNYYTLRRCFRTAADEVCDAVAVDYVMGHADPTMGAVYRQRINDRRLEAVAACVHHWLYGTTETAKGGEG